MHPVLNQMMAAARTNELLSQARARRPAPPKRGRQRDARAVTMRVAHSREDARIAGVHPRELPAGPVLVGELEGRAVAALSLADGEVIASRAVPTHDIVALLELRASQLRQSGLASSSASP